MEFHDFFRQEAHGPSGSPFRRWRTSQGCQAGIEGSIEGHFGNPRTGLARQGRLIAFLNETLFEMLDGSRGDAKGLGNIGDLPCRAMLPGIAEQQGPRMNKFWGGRFPVSGDRFKFAAFFFGEGDFVSWCHPSNLTRKTGKSICEIYKVT